MKLCGNNKREIAYFDENSYLHELLEVLVSEDGKTVEFHSAGRPILTMNQAARVARKILEWEKANHAR